MKGKKSSLSHVSEIHTSGSDSDNDSSFSVTAEKKSSHHRTSEICRNTLTKKSEGIGSTVVNNDVGFYDILNQNIDDLTKRVLIETPWTPPMNYQFPFSLRKYKGKDVRNYVGFKHLRDHQDWLVFSDLKKGLYCKYCPWFTNRLEGGFQKNTPLGVLVTKPLVNFKNLSGRAGDLQTHCDSKYHKDAVGAGKDFLKNFKNPTLQVTSQISETYRKQVQENIERLMPIVKTIIFCGKQNIPLRGHRDDGQLLTGSLPSQNEGNFRALLRFRVEAGDKPLENHLKNASSRSTYISKSTQNALIECCRLEVLERILKQVQEAGFYSILFDEASDVSGKSQISLVLRYVSPDAKSGLPCIKEDFVTFIDAFGELVASRERKNSPDDEGNDMDEDSLGDSSNDAQSDHDEELLLTGIALSEIVLKEMRDMNLNLKTCVGIGTDGCSVMLGENNGAVKKIKEVATNAVATPCYAHKLNLSLSVSSRISIIEKATSVMKEITFFFKHYTPKRNTVLAQVLGKRLVRLCETR